MRSAFSSLPRSDSYWKENDPAVLSRIQIRLVACPAHPLVQLPLQQSATSPALPCRITPDSLIGKHTLQLQSRICPSRSANVDLVDCFSRFVFSFLRTSQSRSLGSEFSGATEIHYYLQSRNVYFGGIHSVLYYACPSVFFSSAVLSRLLDTITKISNNKLI